MSQSNICPRCGVLLPEGVPQDGCLRCLLAAGLLAADDKIPVSMEAKPGSIVGRYKLLRVIGEGGFGIVYLAEQLEPVTREVALKVIKPGMKTGEVISRFEAERQALAVMDHPNIAKVLDAGESDSGVPYFVMELVKGEPITKFSATARLVPRRRLELFVDVLFAVQHAHQKGIIHRDIKPSNILVAEIDGKPLPKVIDFGIARATEQNSADMTIFTEFAQFLGTPAYMSPEQAAMNARDIDIRSDIYSLGVLLYELLTGTPPFDTRQLLKDGFDEMRRVIREVEPPKPSTRQTQLLTASVRGTLTANSGIRKNKSEIDPDLDWVVMKALEKDRERRYDSAGSFAKDIRRHLEGEPVLARPPSLGYRFTKFRHRRPGLVWGCLAGVVGLSVLGFVAWKATIESARREANAIATERQRQVLLQKAAVEVLTSQVAGWSERAWSLLSHAAAIHVDDQLRFQAASMLCGLDATPVKPLKPTPSSWAAFHPDGIRLLVAGRTNGAGLWSGQSETDKIPFERSGTGPVAFLPDGTAVQLLRLADHSGWQVWDLARQKAITNLIMPLRDTNASNDQGETDLGAMMQLTSDGSFAAAGMGSKNETTVVVWRTATGQLLRIFEHPEATALRLSDDGSLIAIGDEKGSIRIWSVSDGTETGSLSPSPLPVRGIALGVIERTGASGITHREWLLAAGDSGGGVTIWDLSKRRFPLRCFGAEYDVYSLAFSPDGTELAVAGRGRTRLVDVITGRVLLVIDGGDYVNSLTYSRDGKKLAACPEGMPGSPGQLGVWQLENGRGIKTLRGLTAQVNQVCFSADSRWMAGLAHNWEIGIWETENGRLYRVLEGPVGLFADNAALGFSPDGTSLACVSGEEARIWNLRTGGSMKKFPLPRGLADRLIFRDPESLWVLRVETEKGIRPQNDWFAPAKDDPRVVVIRNLLGADPLIPLKIIPDFNLGVLAAEAIPDQNWFVLEGKSDRGRIEERLLGAYDAQTGQNLWSLRPLNKTVNYAGFHSFSDSIGFRRLYTHLTDSGAVILDASSGRGLPEAIVPENAVAVSAKGDLWLVRRFAGGSGRGWSILRRGFTDPIVSLDGHAGDGSNTVKFDFAGKQLTWGNDDGTLSLLNLEQVRERLSTEGLWGE